jgi:serine/threonine protein phosphatase PrpC
MTCPNCAAPVAETDAFCENCGTALDRATLGVPTTPEVARSEQDASARTHLINLGEPAEPPPLPCHNCGGVIGSDGWCTVCGTRGSNGREHVTEQPSPTVAAVSDRGRLHPRNEDAFAIATKDGWTALIVCDGVTTAADSDAAAFAAAQAARELLVATERPAGDADEREQHWSLQAKAAAVAADVAAEATATPSNSGASGATAAVNSPPSCTFVAAIADGDVIVAANVGDSRAYWLPDGGAAEQLTTDDSWATEQIRAGVPRDEAEADPKAHAITRWLGIDSPPVDASTSRATAPGPGWLLVCSDGLWNYCSDADQLRDLVNKQPPEPLARAEALVAWANEQGGHDNITVTLARIGDAP